VSVRLLSFATVWLVVSSASAQDFTYEPAGALVPGSGMGRADDNVYVPDMRFPIEEAPAYPNSQVWGVGGSQGPSGSQCDERNFSYPWHDNFCESRDWDMPLCPAGTGHQGQDIRASTCDPDLHWAVAAEDGVITSIGSYSVYLMTDSGTLHRYLHMARSSLAVREGQRVSRGDHMGRVANEFGGTPTTVHLHYDINQNVAGVGAVFVPPYMSLVRSYEELLGMEALPCFVIPPEGTTLDDAGPCFRQYGPVDYWRLVDGDGVGGGMHWTNAWDGDRPGNWAQWRLHFAEPGSYRVEVDVVPPYNVSTRVPYRVRHTGEETDVVIDQSSSAEWIELGVFDFAEGGDQVISIFDNTGETGDDLHITADAVRITPLSTMPDAGLSDGGAPDAMVEDAGMMEPPPDEGCGCVAAGSSSHRSSRGWLAFFGVFALAGFAGFRRSR
jgi:murein DD-endopeptidase MepM/ murein hydrolase activator NlpD